MHRVAANPIAGRIIPAASLTLALACGSAAPQATPADSAAPRDPITLYAGTWHGTTYSRKRDSVIVTWTWVQNRDSSGTLTFGDEKTRPPTRIVFASTHSVVFDLMNPLRFPAGDIRDGARQRYVASVRGDSIIGTSWTTLVDGRRGRRQFDGVRTDR